MNRIRYILFLFLVVTSVFASDSKKHILILHSYNASMSWERHIDKAIDDVLYPYENGYVLHREYMDTKRIFSRDYIADLKRLYALKYKHIHFSIILSSDNNAFDFLRSYRDELFGQDVPVSFCGVNDFHPDLLRGVSNFTGAAELFDAKKTLQVAQKLVPDLQNILIVNDYLVTGRAWTDTIKKQLQGSELNITYAPDLSMPDMQNLIATLPPHSAALLGVYYKDKVDNYFTYEKVGALLAQKATQPIFSLLRFNVGNGIVGGSVIDGYSQGKAMAKIAQKILNGEDPNRIPILEKGVTKLIFDYPSLERYHLDRSNLPIESIVLHEPLSFYQKYKSMLWMFLLIVIVLSFIIVSQLKAIKKQQKIAKLLKKSDEQIKQLNEKLKRENIETQNLFKTFFDNLPIPLFYKNRDGAYLGVNNKFNQIYGFEKNFLIGKTAFDVAPKDLAKKYKEQDNALFQNPHQIQVYESQVKNHMNTKLHDVVFHKTCFFDAQGEVQGIIGAIMEITELKKKEKHLQIANKRSHLIIDNIMEGVIIHDTKVCIDANAKALEIYGCDTKNDLMGKSPFELVSPQDHEKIYLSMQETYPKPYEIMALKIDGSTIPVLIKPFQILSDTEEHLRIVSIIDLSEIKAKEKALIVAKNKAEEATKAKALFLANMSHELRTPMNGILGMLYAITQQTQDLNIIEKIKKIDRSAKSLLHLINDILDYSKIENGKLHLDIQPFDMQTLLDEISELVFAMVEAKGIVFKVECPLKEDIKCYVNGDMFRVKQILLNLLGNAVKFTDEGYVKLFLDKIDKQFIKIKVVDTGIGISEVAKKTIFDSFIQADSSTHKNYGGTGLGLAITKELVELMDGTISLHSKEHEGTTIEVVLRLPQIQAISKKQKQQPPRTEYTYFEAEKEDIAKKEPLSFGEMKKLVEQLYIFAKQHQTKDAKDILKEILSHRLEIKEERFFISLQQMVEQRDYTLVMEKLNEKTNYSRS